MTDDQLAQRAYEASNSGGVYADLSQTEKDKWKAIANAVQNPTEPTQRFVQGQNPAPAQADADGNPLNADGTPAERTADAAAASTGQAAPERQETAQEKSEREREAKVSGLRRNLQDDAEAGYSKKK